jgi:hypothetical protein
MEAFLSWPAQKNFGEVLFSTGKTVNQRGGERCVGLDGDFWRV